TIAVKHKFKCTDSHRIVHKARDSGIREEYATAKFDQRNVHVVDENVNKGEKFIPITIHAERMPVLDILFGHIDIIVAQYLTNKRLISLCGKKANGNEHYKQGKCDQQYTVMFCNDERQRVLKKG